MFLEKYEIVKLCFFAWTIGTKNLNFNHVVHCSTLEPLATEKYLQRFSDRWHMDLMSAKKMIDCVALCGTATVRDVEIHY